MATTATATPRVAEEIAARLGLRDWLAVRSGFDRPNLTFDVVALEGKGAVARKRATLLYALERDDARPAIVYCGTRKDTDEVAVLLREHGLDAVCYHAGMSPDARRSSQEAFMSGRAEVVVATNAFGMGVDKADVRTVVHWAVPTSLEAYYQEAGRGGRDGQPGRALLLASRMDLGRLIRFINERETTVEDVKRYVGSLRARAVEGIATIGHGGGASGDARRARTRAAVDRRACRCGGVAARRSRRAARAAHRRRLLRARPMRRSRRQKTAAGRLTARSSASSRAPRPAAAARSSTISATRSRARPRCAAATSASRTRRWSRLRLAPVGRGSRRVRAAGSTMEGVRRGSGASAHGSANGDAGEEIELDPVDESAFEKLKAWRMGRSEGKPAFTVAANTALEGVLRAKPATLEELIEVKGIGPAFCERHGESLLQALVEL